MVEYKYDAWGKSTLKRTLTTAYDTLATLNPFRYRGYIYDEASGLYYLRSRFYNPVWGRFVNVDTILGQVGIPLDHNANQYCKNNSISYCDPSGRYAVRALANDVTLEGGVGGGGTAAIGIGLVKGLANLGRRVLGVGHSCGANSCRIDCGND